MKISVVIPAFNEEKYIEKCLISLINQTYPRELYEIIVVDNCSTDRTLEIAAAYGVTVISETWRGTARARQKGASVAKGHIMAGTDADALAPPTWLETIAVSFLNDPELGAVTGPIFLYEGKKFERWFLKHISNGATWLVYQLRRGVFPGTNWAVRMSNFWDIGGFNLSLYSGEDIDLAIRLSATTKTIYNPNMLMYISSRRTREGYLNVFSRTASDYIRVVLLGLPPSGQDFIAIR